MLSKLSNGALSPANCARKIAGPFIVFIRVNSGNSTEHLIMFCRRVHTFPASDHARSLWGSRAVLVGIGDRRFRNCPIFSVVFGGSRARADLENAELVCERAC